MGQYYHPAILGENKKTVKAWVYSHDIKEEWTREDGSVFKSGSGLKLMEHSWLKNGFVRAFETLIADNPKRVVWAGDYADDCKGRKSNVYSRCKDTEKVTPNVPKEDEDYRFVINHTKKCYVDKNEVPDNDGWRIHPLPLLTCEGNGRGGGDYRGESSLIGLWARDVVSVSNTEPKGFEKFEFDLVED